MEKRDENKMQLNNKDVKVLRTYTSDMAEAIRDNEVSVIKIAMAEKEKRDKEEIYKKAKGTNLSKVLLLAGGIVLVVVAIFAARYIIQKKKVVPIPPASVVETFIPYNSKLDIDVTNVANTNNLSNVIKNGLQPNPGMVEALFLSRKVGETSEALTSKDFLSLIGTTMPSALVRSLSQNYLLGKYSSINAVTANNKLSTFLVFETTDYNQAYASMLEWEGTMQEDLFVLFNFPKPNDSPFKKPWDDIIVSNRDARVLYGENGEGLLYYAFVNKNNFVITNSIEALKEIIARLLVKNS
jgi:hypothetical protein